LSAICPHTSTNPRGTIFPIMAKVFQRIQLQLQFKAYVDFVPDSGTSYTFMLDPIYVQEHGMRNDRKKKPHLGTIIVTKFIHGKNYFGRDKCALHYIYIIRGNIVTESRSLVVWLRVNYRFNYYLVLLHMWMDEKYFVLLINSFKGYTISVWNVAWKSPITYLAQYTSSFQAVALKFLVLIAFLYTHMYAEIVKYVTLRISPLFIFMIYFDSRSKHHWIGRSIVFALFLPSNTITRLYIYVYNKLVH
jgi:hypothetical protein